MARFVSCFGICLGHRVGCLHRALDLHARGRGSAQCVVALEHASAAEPRAKESRAISKIPRRGQEPGHDGSWVQRIPQGGDSRRPASGPRLHQGSACS